MPKTLIFHTFLILQLLIRLLNQEPRSSFLQEGRAGFHNGFLLGGREVEEREKMMKSLLNQESLQPVKKNWVS